MKIAWTTTETTEQAKLLSKLAVQSGWAVCAQISSPITSLYLWEEKLTESQEIRISLKLLDSNLSGLRQLVLDNHPYDIPQWVVADLSDVSEGYLNWAKS